MTGAEAPPAAAEVRTRLSVDGEPADVTAEAGVTLPDHRHNELGVRGAGEIGAGGMSAAIGNAIHNAVGIRLRDIPMTVDRMFSADGVWRGERS